MSPPHQMIPFVSPPDVLIWVAVIAPVLCSVSRHQSPVSAPLPLTALRFTHSDQSATAGILDLTNRGEYKENLEIGQNVIDKSGLRLLRPSLTFSLFREMRRRKNRYEIFPRDAVEP